MDTSRSTRGGPRIGDHVGDTSSAYSDLLGIELVDVSPQRVTAALEAGPRHHRPGGMVHGGVYCSLVETAASVGAVLTVRGRDVDVVGVHNATDFIRPHTTGRLDAVAEPVHVGASQQLWQVEITRASDGKLVARGQVRLQHVPVGGAASGPGHRGDERPPG